MDRTINNATRTKKNMFLVVLCSAALLAGVFAMPTYQAVAGSCSKSSSNRIGSTSSVASVFRSATLVCASRASALNTLGLDADSDQASAKATICHIPPGNAAAQHTISVAQSAVPAHMAHGDTMGACSGWVTESYIESLPTCTAIDGASTVPGVWLPDSAVEDGPSLNGYFAQLQGGLVSGRPDSESRSYREIKGH